jgi:ubiquinone/menaquinone biosynthesis C-methylase UbiE
MNDKTEAPKFSGSVPDIYHRHMGPLIFEPYAKDLARRLAATGLPPDARILEIACGTGIVTRQLIEQVLEKAAPEAHLVSTDLNEPMLDMARRHLPNPLPTRVELRQADATELPFPDKSFDAIVCQFGLMFFPDKERAAREALRVLRPGGLWIFSVWDSIERNPVTETAHKVIGGFFDDDPPAFYGIPFGYHDASTIEALVSGAGFERLAIEWVPMMAEAPDAKHAARGLVEGTPVANALTERGLTDLSPVVDAVAKAFAPRFGAAPLRSRVQAILVSARRPS